MSRSLLSQRSSGVLLHPTSLPGVHGGDLGPAAYAFADWLAAAGQSWWQMLPVGPPGTARSPYDSPSSFAGSPGLVSLELLVRDGLLGSAEIANSGRTSAARFREQRLRLAHERFRNNRSKRLDREHERARDALRPWLDDWVLFSTLQRRSRGRCWTEWEPELRDRKHSALSRVRQELADDVSYHEFVQVLFERQWAMLHDHCRRRGVALLGDVPMFVAHDSADVWANRDSFFLDRAGERTVVAGVPPDVFSASGQLWGNPLYRWSRMKSQGFRWWIERFATTLRRFDAVRLDHFIGFHRYWEIPAGARSAKRGRFVAVPGEALFEKLRRSLGGLPFVAEDLGLVTAEVHALRERFELPGMRVLAFAFGPGGSDYLPHRFSRQSVVYTGTHDNDTIVSWFRGLARQGRRGREEQRRVLDYVGTNGREIHWDLMRVASMSVANVALFPLQDVLGLGRDARMNTPGTTAGNWKWRARAGALTPSIAERLAELTRAYERVPPGGIFAREDAAR